MNDCRPTAANYREYNGAQLCYYHRGDVYFVITQYALSCLHGTLTGPADVLLPVMTTWTMNVVIMLCAQKLTLHEFIQL